MFVSIFSLLVYGIYNKNALIRQHLFIYSLYLNDLQTYLTDKQNTGVNLEFMENYIVSYIHIRVLLFADDTVILSKSADEFQKCLNDFNQYCMEWN